MSLLALVLVLICIGVLLWVVNTQLAGMIDGKILKIINVVVVIAVVLWLLNVFGIFDLGNIPVPRVGG